jgi:hypothetical protein
MPLLANTSTLYQAAYLYYDAMRALFDALTVLLLARRGRTFSLRFTPEFHQLASDYLDFFEYAGGKRRKKKE